jgi:hypothetical protein
MPIPCNEVSFEEHRSQGRGNYGPHDFVIRYPDGTEKVLFQAKSMVFPGVSYSPPADNCLDQIAQAFGVDFVWRHVPRKDGT